MAVSSYSEIDGGDHVTITYLSALNEIMMAAYNINDAGEVSREDFVKMKGSNELYTFLKRILWTMEHNGAEFLPDFTDNVEVHLDKTMPLPEAKDIVKPEPIDVKNIGVF